MQRIEFGVELTNEHRQRDLQKNIGPNETSKAYQYTSARRKVNQDKVYNVNIPFSKE